LHMDRETTICTSFGGVAGELAMTRKFGDLEGRRPRRAEVTARRDKTLKGRMGAPIAKAKTKAKTKAKAKLKAKVKAKVKAKMPTGLIRGAIEAIIDELREKEKWSFRERHGKKDFYAYLEAVYQVQDWHDGRQSERWSRQVAALYTIDIRKNTHFIRIIIDASCDQDRQVKSRWTQALEYALAKKVSKSGFIEFLEKNGGPAGCAAKMAKLRKKMRNRS
jgi:hypothetical protein